MKLKFWTVEKGSGKMTKALVRAIIRILELNGVSDDVIDQIRALIE